MSRQIVLDTETTGLDPHSGHRVIEIGCVEMHERRLTGNNLHIYLQPDRQIDPGAIDVHGISNEFLIDKPRFPAIADELRRYLEGAELIIHNAEFDVGFLEHEFQLCSQPLSLSTICKVTDTLKLARKMYPGQRNSLDALCKRLDVNNAHRTLHGALLDSEILADVYLRMTGGQTDLSLEEELSFSTTATAITSDIDVSALPVITPNEDELAAHQQWLERLETESANGCVWLKLEAETVS